MSTVAAMASGWGAALSVVLAAAVVAALVVVVRGGSRDRDDRASGILAERYAAGEIDEAEFRTRRRELEDAKRGRGTSGPRTLMIMVILVALIAVAIIAAMGDWPRWGHHGGHGHMGSSRGSSGASSAALADTPEVTVRAGEMWFDPDRITVDGDGSVNITVRNEGAVFHDLTIDELGLAIDVEPGDTVTAGVADVDPGTYEFICSVPGHARAGMTGTLVVGRG